MLFLFAPMLEMLSALFLVVCTLVYSASAETRRSVIDKGYQFSDSKGYIRHTELDGPETEILYHDPNVVTPCIGKNLPKNKTRNAHVKASLSCRGSGTINQIRKAVSWEKVEGFNNILESGDPWSLFEFMRVRSEDAWSYQVPYTTSVEWTWTKYLKGKNGEACGFFYTPALCTRRTAVSTRNCQWVAEPPSSDGGGLSPGGGSGGGGGGIENRNPFSYYKEPFRDFVDFIIPRAYAGMECSAWSTHYEKDDFDCYDRSVKHCEWSQKVTEPPMVCSRESMPVTLEVKKKSKEIWNPDSPDYVAFLPSGNDLLPGESEHIRLKIEIGESGLSYSSPEVGGGEKGLFPSYYNYEHTISGDTFKCQQGARNSLDWQMFPKDRQVTKTPNSLVVNWAGKSFENETDPLDKTGLFNDAGENVVKQEDGTYIVHAVPAVLTFVDSSSDILSTISRDFRASDHKDGEVDQKLGERVSKGQVTAGRSRKYWKDTFYSAQLFEVYPGRTKDPMRVTVGLIQTLSFVREFGKLLTIHLDGRYHHTDTMYSVSSSGLIIPKGFFKFSEELYNFIPKQTYELRISMLHRGIPFYQSGCKDSQVSCEREEPNFEAFSEEIVFPFIYSGTETRGILHKFYDYWRIKSPW